MKKSTQLLLCLVLALALAGCGAAGSSSGSSGTKDVTYLTSFNTFGRDAYAYVALKKGYFAREGLNVTIQPGTGSVDVMKLIASGRAQFGTADFSAAVVTIANEHLPVKAVSAIHQRSLAALIALAGSGITKPKDLVGKTIGDQPGSTNEVIFPTYAAAAGIDPKSVTWVPSAPPSLPQLLVSGKVSAIGQFVVGQPLIEAAASGKLLTVLPYGDLLPDLYGNVLMTSDQLAKSDPSLVAAFNRALLKGLAYSIKHPDETGQILHEYQPTQSASVAAAEVRIMAPYVTGDDGKPIGDLDPARIAKIIKILSPALTSKVTPSDLAEIGTTK